MSKRKTLKHYRKTDKENFHIWIFSSSFFDIFLSIFSFQYHKFVTAGEGGIVLCNDEKILQRIVDEVLAREKALLLVSKYVKRSRKILTSTKY